MNLRKRILITFVVLLFSFFVSDVVAQKVQQQSAEEVIRKLKQMGGATEQQIIQEAANADIPAEEALRVARELGVLKETVETKPELKEKAPPKVTPTEEIKPTEKRRELREEVKFFGYDIFNLSPTTFEPLSFGPVDPDYPIGPGDEISVTVWGDVELYHSLEVNREGNIVIPVVGQVFVSGLTLRELKNKIILRMSKVYSGIDVAGKKGTTFVDVSLGKLRTIKVFIVGDVIRPGGYTLTAVSTVFNALYNAGGPTENGSLRNVRVIRNNKIIAEIDFYEYLLEGKKEEDIRLENYDTILIPPRGKTVTLKGGVLRPAIYELKLEEKLGRLIKIAGGLKPNVYVKRSQIDRIVNNLERKVFDVELESVIKGKSDVDLFNGDVIEFFEVLDYRFNVVSISGNIAYPGAYELREGMKLLDVIVKAGGTLPGTFYDRANIVRMNLVDSTEKIIPFSLGKLLSGDQNENIILQSLDKIFVYSYWSLYEKPFVSIYGAVQKPGVYSLRENMTLKDLIFAAGGYRTSAYTLEAEISRVDTSKFLSETKKGELAKIIKVPIDRQYNIHINPGEDSFYLRVYDNIFIREIPEWELQRNIVVIGEVKFPGVYSLQNKDERLSQLIKRTGGLTESAYPEGAIFTRNKDNAGRIGIDLKKILKEPGSNDDLFLFHGDTIVIPQEPKTVKVLGAVATPSSIIFEKGKGYKYYIEGAGDFTEQADKNRVRIVLANGKVLKPTKWLIIDEDITPGSTIVVPFGEKKVEKDLAEVIKDVFGVTSNVMTTFLVMYQITQIIASFSR
jgi:protein involved in polysaccharide export with SLBB domain